MKKWYESKTVWFNVGTALLIGAELKLSLLKPILGDSLYGILLFGVTLGNIFLRTITTTAIK